jgi:predicted DNA-binding transcriptional regulator AlpA
VTVAERDDPDFITVKEACAIVGGSKPISEPTYYRGVKAGRLPAPEHPTPGLSRVRRGKLIAALNGGA